MENNSQMLVDEEAVADEKDKEDEEAVVDEKDKDEKDEEDEGTVGDEDKKERYVCCVCMENSPCIIGKVYTRLESKDFWICDECSSTFQMGYKVTNKEESEDASHSSEESRNVSPFNCDVCGKGFASVEKLFDHATQHSVGSVSSGGSSNSPIYLEEESWSTSEDTK